MYIVVGGAGDDYSNNLGGAGGYNGGGHGGDGYGFAGGGGGGGATHVALKGGLLSELSDDQDAILMVAGGGGGASWTPSGTYNQAIYGTNKGYGGYGGGLTAGNGNRKDGSFVGSSDGAGYSGTFGYYGYAFGKGQPGRSSRTTSSDGGEGGGGGGGGWYGGYSFDYGYYKLIATGLYRWVDESTLTEAEKTAASSATGSKIGTIFFRTGQGSNTDTAGGGGSGYLNESFRLGSDYYISSSGELKSGIQSMPSPTFPNVTITGNTGNGAFRITKL